MSLGRCSPRGSDMDNKLSAFADRLKARLNGTEDLLIPEQEVVDLMNNDLDKISAAAAHSSCHISTHSSHGSMGQEAEDVL